MSALSASTSMIPLPATLITVLHRAQPLKTSPLIGAALSAALAKMSLKQLNPPKRLKIKGADSLPPLCLFQLSIKNSQKLFQLGRLQITHMGNPEGLAFDLAVAVIKGIAFLTQTLFHSSQVNTTTV